MWLPPSKYSPMTQLMPLPTVSSVSSAVWRMAVMYLLTSRSSVMTSSWHGASSCETSTGLSGRVIAWAIRFVRSVGPSKPNMRSMTLMSEKRFVMARAWGLPLTRLNISGGPPSRCFCKPVISRSGSTSTSVVNKSPCESSHSRAERKDVMSFFVSFFVSSAVALDMGYSLLPFLPNRLLYRTSVERMGAKINHRGTEGTEACTEDSSVPSPCPLCLCGELFFAIHPTRISLVLREDALLLQLPERLFGKPGDVEEDFFVILREARRGAADAARRFAQAVRDHAVAVLAHLRVRLLLPDFAEGDLRVCEQVPDRVDVRRVDAARLQPARETARVLVRRPRSHQAVEFALVLFAPRRRPESLVREPALFARGTAQALPLRFVPATDDAPLTVAARVAAVRRGYGVAVAVAAGDHPVGRVVQERAGDELQPRLVLREVNKRALARAPAVVERGQHTDAAVGDGDEINVRPVEEIRGAIGFADQVREAAQGRELRAEAWVRGVRPRLSHVARAQHDEARLVLAQSSVTES